jgi:hypothetical protein
MIISASRRTDIPSFYSDWFFDRVREGFLMTRNPIRYRQISRLSLAPEAVDGFVFWTKNPRPMFGRLSELKDYMYYFQYTVTPYGRDIEPNLPDKTKAVLSAFKTLSDKLGPDRVIWRYDPIFLNARYTRDVHLRAFEKIVGELRGCTRKVTVSFLDARYRNVKTNIHKFSPQDLPAAGKIELASDLAGIAQSHGLAIETCAETLDLSALGIGHAHCIDGALFEKLLGKPLKTRKDPNQRPGCGCAASVDIGAYNTCRNGCLYCYANYNQHAVAGNTASHDPMSPLITGIVGAEDTVTERRR